MPPRCSVHTVQAPQTCRSNCLQKCARIHRGRLLSPGMPACANRRVGSHRAVVIRQAHSEPSVRFSSPGSKGNIRRLSRCSAAISRAEKPNSLSTASVCSPASGGGAARREGVRDYQLADEPDLALS